MILSSTASDAIKALAILSDGERKTSAEVGAGIGKSMRWARHICGELRRVRILKSVKGRADGGGGFELARPLQEVELREVLDAFRKQSDSCPISEEHCTEERPCALHRHVRQALSLTAAEVCT